VKRFTGEESEKKQVGSKYNQRVLSEKPKNEELGHENNPQEKKSGQKASLVL